jgi:hypothetical protein
MLRRHRRQPSLHPVSGLLRGVEAEGARDGTRSWRSPLRFSKLLGCICHPRGKPPKHPGNLAQKNPLGRDGSADLPKRIKEGAYKTIDLKAEYARIQSMAGRGPKGGPGGNLTTWLRASKPLSYLFIAARVTSPRDHGALLKLVGQPIKSGIEWASLASNRFPSTSRQPYMRVSVPRDVELSAVLFSACQDLAGITTIEEVRAPPGFAEEAASLIDGEQLQAADEDESG